MHKALCESSAAQYVKSSPQFRNNAEHTGEAAEKSLGRSNAPQILIQWKGVTTGPISSSPAVALEPIDNGNRHVAYVASFDGYLYAFNADNCLLGGKGLDVGQDCQTVWKFSTGQPNFTSPAIADEMVNGAQTSVVYFAGGDGNLYALNAVTGQQIWTTPIGGSTVYSSPAVSNGVVYVLTGGTLGSVAAFDATSGGSALWQGTSPGSASPAVANGIVYMGDVFGTFRAFDANGCKSSFCSPLWSAYGYGRFESSAAVSNGKVYVGSDDNNLYVFDAAGVLNCTGNTCQPLWTATLKGTVRSSPAVSNGVVYVTAGDTFYAFDAAGVTNCSGSKCQPLWTGPINGTFPASSPVVANGVVYVGSDDGNLYAFDAGCSWKTCSPLVTAKTHDAGTFALSSSPTVVDGSVYVGSSDGTLYILNTCGYVCRVGNNQSLY